MSKSIVGYNSNSAIPPEYQHETDYRNIPQEYLNKNIPQGRGMIKWAPFATMPQQFEEIRKQIERQNHVPRPSLSEDQLNELNSRLLMYMNRPEQCVITVYNEGYIQNLKGIIMDIDIQYETLMLKVDDSMILKTINFIDIISIE